MKEGHLGFRRSWLQSFGLHGKLLVRDCRPQSKACQDRPAVVALQSCASPWRILQWHWTCPTPGWVFEIQSMGKRIQPRSIVGDSLPRWMGSQVVVSRTACKPSWLPHTPGFWPWLCQGPPCCGSALPRHSGWTLDPPGTSSSEPP